VDSLAHEASRINLQRLTRCEHPLLRATACLALLKRKDADHLAVINQHLDDTALISVDRGEWGLKYEMVSDELLLKARWKTKTARWTTTDSVFLRHNYLEAAYIACNAVDIRPEYYPSIKEMAQRTDVRFLFERKENALYGLARFGRKEDIPLIRNILLSYHGMAGYTSMRLMQEFPDTAYWEVLKTLYPRWFGRQLCSEYGYSTVANEYVDAVASQQSDSSARLLHNILHRTPFCLCKCDSDYYRDNLLRAVWNNPCPAYLGLRKEIETAVLELERRDRENSLGVGPPVIWRDSVDEPVRWW
jgi:hypothetical protein